MAAKSPITALRKMKAFLLLPICLLFLNAFEEVLIYKLQQQIRDPYTLTIVLLTMFTAGFALVASIAVPIAKDMLHGMHTSSEKSGGAVGVVAMYVGIAVLLFFMYYTIYNNGAQYLLPRGLR